jgi:hypothetical protein
LGLILFCVVPVTQVKAAYTEAGVNIVADESMKNIEDVPLLKDLVHGVNVKLEKTGGIRPGIQAIVAAKQAGLLIWVLFYSKQNINKWHVCYMCCFPTDWNHGVQYFAVCDRLPPVSAYRLGYVMRS